MLFEENAIKSEPPAKVEMHSSRIKIGFIVLFFMWPYLILVPSPTDSHGRLWKILILALCTIFVLMFLRLFIAPYKLTLDPAGFTLSGGLAKPSNKILWQDIDRFCVDPGGRGTKVVGYRFVEGREPPAKFSWMRGRGELPSCWRGSTEDMVHKLNNYRRRALSSEES